MKSRRFELALNLFYFNLITNFLGVKGDFQIELSFLKSDEWELLGVHFSNIDGIEPSIQLLGIYIAYNFHSKTFEVLNFNKSLSH